MTASRTTVDLGGGAFEPWLRAVFDRPADAPPGAEWYWTVDITVTNPNALILHFARLCHESGQVLQPYSLPQVGVGLWCLLGPRVGLGAYLYKLLVPLKARLDCIDAMYDMFANYVAAVSPAIPMENVFYMWWELIAKGQQDQRSTIGADVDLVNERLLAVLTRVLAIDDDRCQEYAIHGLGHLRHARDRVQQILFDWLARRGEGLTAEQVLWVRQCAAGTMM